MSDLLFVGLMVVALAFFILNEKGKFGPQQKSISAFICAAGMIAFSVFQYPPERPFQMAGIIIFSLMAGVSLAPLLKSPKLPAQEVK